MKLRSALKLPKEHGAWAMFYIPFVLGLLVSGNFNVPSLLLLIAATAAFISRESLLIWWRARRRAQPRRRGGAARGRGPAGAAGADHRDARRLKRTLDLILSFQLVQA